MADTELIGRRLAALRAAMARRGLGAWIAETSDPFLSEYIHPHWQSLRWVSGFTGSTAALAVTASEAALFTDSRYWEQAEKELDGTGIELVRLGSACAPSLADWLGRHLGRGERAGIDPQCASVAQLRGTGAALREHGIVLSGESDIFGEIWTEGRPERPMTKVFAIGSFGRTGADKIRAVRASLKDAGAGALLETSLDGVAWMTGLRGRDIRCNPVFLSALIVTPESAAVFTDRERFDAETLAQLAADGFELSPWERFDEALSDAAQRFGVLYDPDSTPAALLPALAKGKSTEAVSPVTLMKSRKSAGELAAVRAAMLEDGTALTEFYAELGERLAKGETLTEADAAAMLHEHRAAQKDFVEESFETIAAFGPNAAMAHYQPSAESSAAFSRAAGGLLLIDSGGQYLTGTTDVTRMTAVGLLTNAMKRDVTFVMKSHIALARARVPLGSAGAQLDAIAREPLWKAGLNFGHGTGHGVGFMLSVHEGPFTISPRALRTGELGAQPGIIVSDEPGVYRPGKWGVRIENLLALKKAESTEFDDFLDFSVLTLCPIDPAALDAVLLDAGEKAWLRAYHEALRQKLSGRLSERAAKWLEAVCESYRGM